jgi:hypothetical protein
MLAVIVFEHSTQAEAQIRGLYTPGMNATNSGVMPGAGLTYQGLFQLYSFDALKGEAGEALPVNGKAALFIDQNIFIWVSSHHLLGGAYVAMADLPVANSSLTTVAFGTIAGGSGLADTFFSPFTLAWKLKRAEVQAGYSFVAPTGRFTPGATDNVGGGYWGHLVTSGQTVYLTANKATAVSAWEGYEFHGDQKTTNVHPGQTFDVDYSLTQMVPLEKNEHTLLQLGVIGYGQYQTTDRTGGTLAAITGNAARYRVNAIGAAGNIILPERKVTVGIKWLKEYSNRSTVEGQSLQIAGAVTF